MAWKRTALGKRDAAVGDAYRSLADLLNLHGAGAYRVSNGIVTISVFGVTVSYGAQPTDLAAGAGTAVAVGAGIGLQSSIAEAWDLNEIWLRNTTPGSVGTVVLNGPVWVGSD